MRARGGTCARAKELIKEGLEMAGVEVPNLAEKSLMNNQLISTPDYLVLSKVPR